MALSLSEELQILTDTEDLNVGGLTDFPLSELVYQSAVGRAVAFGNEAKSSAVIAGNEDAQSYQDKVLSTANRIARKDATTLDTMRKVLIAIVGDSTFNYAQVLGADSDAWQTVFEGTLIAGVDILTVMEITGGVLAFEKTAWSGV